MSLLETFIASQVFAFIVIFSRLGCIMMIMPGFSDTTVPMNIRLQLALAFSFIMMPALMPFLPPIPQTPVGFAVLVAHEMLVGVFIGLMTQVMMNSINLAGVLIAHATSLSSAFTFNPQMAAQSTVITSFMSLLGTVLIFATDLHHLLIMGMIDSYRMFSTQSDLIYGDMALALAKGISEALRIGLMISAPFVIVAFGVFVAMGLVARLVPQIQVFVLSVPVQVVTGMIILMTSISAMMLYFMNEYELFWKNFLSV